MTATIVDIKPKTWSHFRSAMMDARSNNEEVLGFLFCTSQALRGTGRRRLLPKHWVVPSPDCYVYQSSGGLELQQEVHVHLLNTYLCPGIEMIHIHTHPGSHQPNFSRTDNDYEARYANFLSGFRGDGYFVSGVFNQDMTKWTFREWQARSAETQVIFSPSLIMPNEYPPDDSPQIDERFARQQIWGSGAQKNLERLKVGLIGCGGIGAVFAEQLARLGVRKWVLIDPDGLEITNLNRMPFATMHMAQNRRRKVDYVRTLIQRSWQGRARVIGVNATVDSSTSLRELSQCDIFIVATDNHHSRIGAQELALRYMRPLISLATHIDVASATNQSRLYARVTMPPPDGGWCLVCGDVVSAHRAAIECSEGELADQLRGAGYLRDVPAPAVYWLNSLCASLGCHLVHGIIAGFIDDLGAGVDWTLDVRSGNWLKIAHEPASSCFFCSPEGQLANLEQNVSCVSE
jgi:hypothetical protein